MIGQHISNFYYFKKDDVKLLKTASQFVKLIICDETSMVPFLNFLKIHLRLNQIFSTKSQKFNSRENYFFENKNVLLFSDFLQLPPVGDAAKIFEIRNNE